MPIPRPKNRLENGVLKYIDAVDAWIEFSDPFMEFNREMLNWAHNAPFNAQYRAGFQKAAEQVLIYFAGSAIYGNDWLGRQQANNAVKLIDRLGESVLFQGKKRQWGLFIKLKRSSPTRSPKKNRLYIRMPHK